MKTLVLIVVCVAVLSFTLSQQTDQQWQVVTNKLQASNNSNFFLLIGNESGIVFTFQKGDLIILHKILVFFFKICVFYNLFFRGDKWIDHSSDC